MDKRTLDEALKVQGWDLRVDSKGYTRYFAPNGEYVTDYPATASSETRLRNTVAAVRRAGAVYPIDKKALKALGKRLARA